MTTVEDKKDSAQIVELIMGVKERTREPSGR